METLKAEPDRPRPRVTPPRRSTERADKAAERAREERQRQEAQADEEQRKKEDAERKKAEAERKKAEPAPPRNIEEAAQQCGGRCDVELKGYLGNKGSKVHEIALRECLRRRRCPPSP
jgi:membrane protein involved in colicin uptake